MILLIALLLTLCASFGSALDYEPQDLYLSLEQVDQQIDVLLKQNSALKKVPALLEQLFVDFSQIAYQINCSVQAQTYSVRVYNPKVKYNALIVCGLHSRQIHSVDTCLAFLKSYLKNKKLRNTVNLEMFVRFNPTRENVFNGQWCRRTDPFDVDLNRNFPVNFDHGYDPSDPDTYHGEYPLSQPAVKCMDERLKQLHRHIFIDVHTGELTMYYDETLDTFSKEQLIHKVLNPIKQQYCKMCDVRSLTTSKQPLTSESYLHAYRNRGVQFSTLLEIYTGLQSYRFLNNKESCFVTFSPVTPKARDFYVNKWKNALTSMLFKMANTLPSLINQKSNTTSVTNKKGLN